MRTDGKSVFVPGCFDDPRSVDVRFLQEAAALGEVHVLLLSDEACREMRGSNPAFPEDERRYFIDAIRFVGEVTVVPKPPRPSGDSRRVAVESGAWVVRRSGDPEAVRASCEAAGLDCVAIPESDLRGFPDPLSAAAEPAGALQKKVLVTGCFDWLHSGHIRFFEETSELGDLYVIVGNDSSVALLKGEDHPMFPAVERRYMVSAVRHVTRAFISSGLGWLDAVPEIEHIQPDLWVVNEDGDRPEKREYCEANGIEYRILERRPRSGLPIRRSVDLRGF